jgi:hypothetical protein
LTKDSYLSEKIRALYFRETSVYVTYTNISVLVVAVQLLSALTSPGKAIKHP